MKHLKLYVAPLIAGAVAILAPMASQAAFVGMQRSTVTASAVFPASAGQIAMTVQVLKTADNTVDPTGINWNNPVVGSFSVASDYVKLDSTLSITGAGIQIYTDNTAPDASPRFTGLISSFTATPAGLVNATDTTKTLPMAWTIQDLLGTPVAIDPNAVAPGNTASAWLYFEDHAQVANPDLHAGNFLPGDAFVTVQNTTGIHYDQDPAKFGVASSPNYIYVESDFRSALGGTTYKTSTLRLEAYTQ